MLKSRHSLERVVPVGQRCPLRPGRGQTPLHHHSQGQILYPAGGIVGLSTANGSWIVTPDRAAWIPPGSPHACRAYSCGKLCTLLVDLPDETAAPPGPRIFRVTTLLRELLLALTCTSQVGPMDRPHMMAILANAVCEASAPPQELFLPMPIEERLRAVAERLQADPSDNTTLAEHAAQLGASERTLSRLFHEELGMGFRQWRAQLRLHFSLALLAGGAEVSQVAYDCGWANPSSFVAAFSASLGVTPGQYRAALQDASASARSAAEEIAG